MRSLLRQIFRSALLMVWIETVIRFGMALIVLPIAVINLSQLELSIWLMFNFILGIASLADVGLAPTLLRATAYFKSGTLSLPASFDDAWETVKGKPNWEGIRALVATSGSIYFLVGLSAAVLLVSVGGGLVWNLMSIAGHPVQLWLAFGVLAAWACVQVRIARWSGILQGLGKVAQSKRIDSLVGAFRIATFAAVLCLGLGVLGLCCAGLAIVSLNLYLIRRATLTGIPQGPTETLGFDSELFSSIWPATWRLGSMNLAAYLIYNGGVLIVAQLPDVNLIASYLLSLRIILLLRQVAQAPMIAYMPLVVASLANRDMYAFRNWTSRIVAIGLVIFVTGIAGLVAFGDGAIAALSPEKELLPYGILLWLGVAHILELHHSIHASLYVATNRVPFLWPAVASGLAIVGLGVLVLPSYGVFGIVAVQIIVQAFFNNWFPVYLSLRISDWRFLDYLVSLIRTPRTLLVQAARRTRHEIQESCFE